VFQIKFWTLHQTVLQLILLLVLKDREHSVLSIHVYSRILVAQRRQHFARFELLSEVP
jgi:hypothetical protein